MRASDISSIRTPIAPVTEKTPHMAYPGCYALSKVLEEVMLSQFCIQYGLNACCLRAPWIMEKDDFQYTLSFGDDVFGGPVWKTMVSPEVAEPGHAAKARYRFLQDAGRKPLKRNFVHVDDLVAAIPACPRQSVDCIAGSTTSAWMSRSITAPSPPISSRPQEPRPHRNPQGQFHSNWMDNSKAKYELGWRPHFDLARLIDAAWDIQARFQRRSAKSLVSGLDLAALPLLFRQRPELVKAILGNGRADALHELLIIGNIRPGQQHHAEQFA